MGGALVLGYATRTPPRPLVGRLAGIVSSSPLLRQSKGVKAPALIVRAGSLIGKLSAALTLKATVKPEVRRAELAPSTREALDLTLSSSARRIRAATRPSRRRTPRTRSASRSAPSAASATCSSACVALFLFLDRHPSATQS